MNRIAIILVTICMVCCSGCIEIGYKSEVNLSLFKQEDTTPRIVDYGYPVSPVKAQPVIQDVEILEIKEELKRLKEEQEILNNKPKLRFTKFQN